MGAFHRAASRARYMIEMLTISPDEISCEGHAIQTDRRQFHAEGERRTARVVIRLKGCGRGKGQKKDDKKRFVSPGNKRGRTMARKKEQAGTDHNAVMVSFSIFLLTLMLKFFVMLLTCPAWIRKS
jgi:hypothetical protein